MEALPTRTAPADASPRHRQLEAGLDRIGVTGAHKQIGAMVHRYGVAGMFTLLGSLFVGLAVFVQFPPETFGRSMEGDDEEDMAATAGKETDA
ncbi:hypothetical protein [Streptomyces sp. NPDC058486]|uniref:hypothetical protein n=1 Tax=unclassified Streptomyces TaxID=2593676 RepID=UPI0036542355